MNNGCWNQTELIWQALDYIDVVVNFRYSQPQSWGKCINVLDDRSSAKPVHVRGSVEFPSLEVFFSFSFSFVY